MRWTNDTPAPAELVRRRIFDAAMQLADATRGREHRAAIAVAERTWRRLARPQNRKA
jgi:hypothetical protein